MQDVAIGPRNLLEPLIAGMTRVSLMGTHHLAQEALQPALSDTGAACISPTCTCVTPTCSCKFMPKLRQVPLSSLFLDEESSTLRG